MVTRSAATHFAWMASSLALASALHGQAPGPALDLAHPQGTNAGIFAFTARCAGCHDTGKNGAYPELNRAMRRALDNILRDTA